MSEVFQKTKKTVKVGENKDIELELPRLTLDKILAVTESIDKLIKAAQVTSPQLFDLFSGTKDNLNMGMELVKLVPSILPAIMKEMVDVLSIYLDKDKVWITKNMDMEDLVTVSVPFFESILNQANHLTGALSNLFPAKEVSIPPLETLSTSSETPMDGA